MKKSHQVAYLLFWLAALADLWFVANNVDGRFFTKPLLMPLLALGYALETKPLGRLSSLVLAALFFSWLGDVLLMLEGRNSMFFILGLLGFLTAHALYIAYFSRIPASEGGSFVRKRPVMLLAVLAYVVELLYVLWPSLNGMKIPVLVYGIVIGTMLCFALWQYGKIHPQAAGLLIIGALLFVASDSLLAINKFKSPIPFGGIWVMSTYVLAQFCIVKGSAKQILRLRSADNALFTG
jgi:uncharacterized membrane protein YhhN